MMEHSRTVQVVAPGFEAAAEAFAENLARKVERGAACTVYHRGRKVLDVWGGAATAESEWQPSTLVPVFSVSKGVAAVSVLSLVDRGLLELDAPIARYWPEFGVHGKERVTVREGLGHRAGVPCIDGPISLEDLRDPVRMASRLASQAPSFEPGTAHLYHAITVGWIAGELVRRLTGQPFGLWVREQLAEPLGIDLWFGLTGETKARVARLEDEAPIQDRLSLIPHRTLTWQAVTLNGALSIFPNDDANDFNHADVQALELGGAGLITNADSLAKLYAACLGQIADVPRLLSPKTIEEARSPVSTGCPWGMDVPGPSWGAGVMIPWEIQPMLGRSSFGHDGFGGSLAFADPLTGTSFAYVRNRLATGGVKDAAVYRVVEAVSKAIR